MINSVIFDMDGILFDSERIYTKAWFRVGERMRLHDIDGSVTYCIGRNIRDTRSFLLDKYGPEFPCLQFSEDIREAFQEIVAEEGLPLKTGVHELLSWLKDSSTKLGLATSTSRKSAMAHLEGADLTRYFPVIVTGDMIQNGKPDPEIYLQACQKLGVLPGDTYAIEDSPNGIKSAHAAGLRVIMVPDLISPTPEIEKLLLEKFDTLLDVKAYFESFSKLP